MNVTRVTKQYRAEIAHRLPNHPEACFYIHGHSYLFEVTVQGKIKSNGMVQDFKNLKQHLDVVIGPWDHSLILFEEDLLIRQLEYLPGINLNKVSYIPTAENMAGAIASELAVQFNYDVYQVRVWETATSYADWVKGDLNNA